MFFAAKISQIFRVTSELSDDGRTRHYRVQGQLFFASVEQFAEAFDFGQALDKVVIDVSQAHIWDISSVTALDTVILKFRRDGAQVEVVGMNKASQTLVGKLGESDKEGALERMLGH